MSHDITNPDFWFTFDGTVPLGRGVPFEHAELELFKHVGRGIRHFSDELFDDVWIAIDPFIPARGVIGAGMVVLGTGILIPGPFDAMAAGAGLAFGGPLGAVVGVVSYNLAGVALLLGGTYLVATS